MSTNITPNNTNIRVVTINTPGPQGPPGQAGSKGAPGPTGSADGIWLDIGTAVTTSYDIQITGSLTVSGSNTFTNIGPAVFTGDISTSGNISASTFVGDGSGLTGIISALSGTGLISSSAQIASEVSGAFDSVSASLASDITANAGNITTNTSNISGVDGRVTTLEGKTLVSSSTQIASEVSGAFDSVSASLASDIATNTGNITTNLASIIGLQSSVLGLQSKESLWDNAYVIATGLDGKTLISSSAQIASEVSGAFDSVSASLASDITTNIGNISTNTSDISGVDGRVTTLEGKALVSSSTQFNSITEPFTGSFTGSFTGDGSGLTGLSAADSLWYNGTTYISSSNDVQITGSLLVSGSAVFTGSVIIDGITYPTLPANGNGNTLVYDGVGALTIEPTRIYAQVKNKSGTTLPKGTPVHASSSTGNNSDVIAASASVPDTMPATYILAETLADEAEGLGIVTGFINGIDTSNFGEGDVVYVGASGGYTNVKPTGSSLIQNLGIVNKVAVNGSGFIYGSGRAAATPNLLQSQIFFGSGSNQAYQIHISGALDDTVINHITASGTVSASAFIGDGTNIDNVTATAVAYSDITGKPTLVSSSAQFQTITDPFTGSFTGSFVGDGSGLTGLPAADSLWYNGTTYISSSVDVRITGSLLVSGSTVIQGSGSDILTIQNLIGENILTVGESNAGYLSEVQNSSGDTLFGVSATQTFVTNSLKLHGDQTITGSLLVSGSTTINGDFDVNSVSSLNRFRVNETGSRLYTGSVQYPTFTSANIGTSTASIQLDSNYYQFIRQGDANTTTYIEPPSNLDASHDGLSFKIIYRQDNTPGTPAITISASDGTGIVNYDVPNPATRVLEFIYSDVFRSNGIGSGTGWIVQINSGSV